MDLHAYRSAQAFFQEHTRWLYAFTITVVLEDGYRFHPNHREKDLLPIRDESRLLPILQKSIRPETKRAYHFGCEVSVFHAAHPLRVGGLAIAEVCVKKDLQFESPFLIPLVAHLFAPIHCTRGDSIRFSWKDGGIKVEY